MPLPWGTHQTTFDQKTSRVGSSSALVSYQASASRGTHQTQWWLHEIGETRSPVKATTMSAENSRCRR